MAIPTVVLTASTALLVSSLTATADPADFTVVAGTPTCDTGTGKTTVTFTVTGVSTPDGAVWGSTLVSGATGANSSTVTGQPTVGSAVTTTPITVTVVTVAGFTSGLQMEVDANYPGDPDPVEKQTISSPVTVAFCGPPTPPTNVQAPAATVTDKQVRLTWTASTVAVLQYRIERCTGAGCTSFSPLGNTTTTSYVNSSGVEADTTYRYRVYARSDPSLGTAPFNAAKDSTGTILTVTTKAVGASGSATPSDTATTSAAPTTTAAAAPTTVRPTAGTGAQSGSSSKSNGPSLLMLGGTAGILLAFVIALIFLIRERSMLKRARAGHHDDEDEGGYWSDQHGGGY